MKHLTTSDGKVHEFPAQHSLLMCASTFFLREHLVVICRRILTMHCILDNCTFYPTSHSLKLHKVLHFKKRHAVACFANGIEFKLISPGTAWHWYHDFIDFFTISPIQICSGQNFFGYILIEAIFLQIDTELQGNLEYRLSLRFKWHKSWMCLKTNAANQALSGISMLNIKIPV